MCARRRRQITLGFGFIQLAIISFLVGYALAQAHPSIPAPVTVVDVRLGYLEEAVRVVQAEHSRMLWLLLGNLFAAVGSIVTYFVTHRRP